MSVINTNVNAIIARNASAVNERSMTKAMQQLSTGKRINVAADDAAGLAISTKMTSQVRGLDQAVRNANDGIAMLQVVEGATVEMTNMLQRMRELAVQSVNDTNSNTERSYLDDEFQQLRQEIDRIARSTQWNGVNVMDGNTGLGSANATDPSNLGGRTMSYQVGANASQTVSFQVADFTTAGGATAEVGSIALAATVNIATIATLDLSDGTNSYSISASSAFTDNLAILQNGLQTHTAAQITAARTAAETALESMFSGAGVGNISVSISGAGTAAADGALTVGLTDSEGRNWTGNFYTSAPAAVTGSTAYAASTAGVASGAVGVFASAGLNDLVITDGANAAASVTALSNAMTSVNEQRSAMGAMINRLTYAADNLTNTSANVTAARSRVLDTDYASATTELARTQIIQQASTAMLAQANQGAQSVLSLLK